MRRARRKTAGAGTPAWRPLALLLLFLACLHPLAAQARDSIEPKHVLLLNSYHLGYLWNVDLLKGMHDVLNRSEIPLRLRYEFMDAKHYSSDAFVDELRSLFRRKYRNAKFDVIIASDNDAFNFLRRFRDELFPGTPVVFCGVNNFSMDWLKGFGHVTGVSESFDLKGTMELALRLVPSAKHMVVVGGVDTSSRMNHQIVVDLMPQFTDRVDFIDLYGLNPGELGPRLQAVPKDSVLLYLAYYYTPDGSRLTVQESVDFVYKNSGLPMFSAWSYLMEDGMVGGKMLRAEDQGREAAQMAMRILRGEKAEDIPVEWRGQLFNIFSYPMLKRFGIDLEGLPEDSIILDLDQSLFERNRGLVLGVGLFILYQSGFIIWLLISNRRRKHAENRLRREETQLALQLEFSRMAAVPMEELLQYALPRIAEHQGAHAGLLFLHLRKEDDGHLLLWEQGRLRHARLAEAEDMADMRQLRFLALNDLSEIGEASPDLWKGLENPVQDQAAVSQILDDRAALLLAVAGKRRNFDRDALRALSLFCHDLLRLVHLRLDESLQQELENQLTHSQKMEELGTFTSSIAHDFNNILASIASCCELALDEIPADLANPRGDVRQALRSSQRGRALIRRLLDFSRREPSRMLPVSLSRLAAESLDMVRPLIPADIAVHEDICRSLHVMGDSDKLSLVIINLLTNAIQAMADGGTLSLRVGLGENGEVRLEVGDDGCGMPPEVLDKIFNPFFTTRAKGKGTGLGLSVVDGIIRNHDGNIAVDSAPGRGTRFLVTLPAADPAELTEQEEAQEPLPTGGDEHLLVVDDDRDVARALKRQLERLGYAVTLAFSGPEALAAFGDGGLFSLVVTDYDMPGMSGVKLAHTLRAATPELPVIMMTGFNSQDLPEDNDSLIAAGIRSVVYKPVDFPRLARSIRAMLDETLPDLDSGRISG